MFFFVKCPLTIKSTTSGSMLTAIISAARPLHFFRGTTISRMVTHRSVSDPLITMPHPQDGQEGEDNDRAVAMSRPARNLWFPRTCTVVLAIMFTPNPVSPRSPDGRFQSSNVVGMEKPGPPALSTNGVSTSQERQTKETNKSAW